MYNHERPRKDRSWWPVIVAAVIGAIATIVVGFVANTAGALHITVAPLPTHTLRITQPPAPTVTVTVTSGTSGGTGSASCVQGQNCRVWNLSAPMGANAGAPTGIEFNQGQVLLNTDGDLDFEASSDGTPELAQDSSQAYSLDVTAQNASKQQCLSATTSHPDANSIINFHTGLLFCIVSGDDSGVALVEETAPLGSSNILKLKETFWPTQNS